MADFFNGALFISCVTACVVFLRFWRDTREPLFARFGAAILVLGASYLALSIRRTGEHHTLVYALRAAGFAIILYAVVEKNRRTRR